MRIARRPVVPVALLAAAALALSALAVPAGSVSAAELAAVEGSPNGPDPYFPRDGNGGYQVRHYAIDDRYVPGTDRLTGRTTLTAVAGSDALSAFHLDLRLTPDAVSVDGRPATFSKPHSHELRVVPATPVAAGSVFEVTVRYHGYPARLAPGTVWDGFFRAPGEAAAVGEPQIGPWWFAANETPRDKATFDITIRVPRGQQAISNGRLVSRTTAGDWTAWRWRINQPITTYLAFFVAGRFELRSRVVDDRRYLYAASRKLSESQRERSFRLLGQTPRVLGWLERRFGPYPYSGNAGGVMSAVYTGFALENASRPFYSWIGGPGPLELVVHELAHQWFGNTVALELWQDTWLNEGFATYVEWLWSESQGGPTVDDILHETYGAPADWTLKISDPGPDDIFSSPIYQRGGMMLAALRCRIGGTAMRGLTRAWVDQHRGGTGTGTQFRALAEERSGQELDAFFQHWLDDTSKPDETIENGLGGCA